MEKTQLYKNCIFGFENQINIYSLNENKEKWASQYLNIHKFWSPHNLHTNSSHTPRPPPYFFQDDDYTILKYIFCISKVTSVVKNYVLPES